MNFVNYLLDITVCLRRVCLIPLPGDSRETERRLEEAGWALPVIGALLGGIAAMTYIVVAALGLGPGLAAVIAGVVSVGLTGAGPERALAGAAALLSTRDRETGATFGEWSTISLILALAIRIGVIAAIEEPAAGTGALGGAGAIGYAALMAAIYTTPDPEAAGLAADLGRPGIETAGAAVFIGLVISVLVVPNGWFMAAILAALATALVIWPASRCEPSSSGTIGLATLPVAEMLALLAIAATR